MNITKIAAFTEEEKNKLIEVGELLGSTSKQFKEKQIDILEESDIDLIIAIRNVCSEVMHMSNYLDEVANDE